MHIAICDDNMADRKQLERLLKKEAQVYASESEPLYVDSYGNSDALLKSPMLYDVFLVDMCHGTTTGVDIYNNLRAYGVSAPVVLCSSLIRYQDKELPDDVLFLDKPIKKDELSSILTRTLSMKQSLIPHIELREESGEHYYVTEADIMYAVACGRYLKVTLTNKKVLSVLSTVDNLYCQLDNYPSLFPINHKVLINGRYLKKIHFMTAVMTDGERFSIAPTSRAYAKYALEEFKPENSSKAH